MLQLDNSLGVLGHPKQDMILDAIKRGSHSLAKYKEWRKAHVTPSESKGGDPNYKPTGKNTSGGVALLNGQQKLVVLVPEPLILFPPGSCLQVRSRRTREVFQILTARLRLAPGSEEIPMVAS